MIHTAGIYCESIKDHKVQTEPHRKDRRDVPVPSTDAYRPPIWHFLEDQTGFSHMIGPIQFSHKFSAWFCLTASVNKNKKSRNMSAVWEYCPLKSNESQAATCQMCKVEEEELQG